MRITTPRGLADSCSGRRSDPVAKHLHGPKQAFHAKVIVVQRIAKVPPKLAVD
eukprot:CAMPEP_0171073404 /NCGR_PEP_ID=MMETSP0766_2-20121228/11491_1 /TAXON_ID=439317 /ORGANISM="Gambierdiscus australes, Strain CAWD 149" /LENGTH=52 /DNA_ID=CAMNT_0011530091 /DNA_START=27 /DNA_END=182 /DNA_ORIENTATION=+